MPAALTPLGTRTKAGFVTKYGAKQGPLKFEAAMENGMIDRGKMENIGLAADPDAASEATESPTSDASEGEVDPTTPPPMMMSPAEMAAMKKKMLTSGAVGRSAKGTLQKRPG